MKDQLLRQIPSITQLLAHTQAAAWLAEHPRKLVTDCLRDAVEELRRQVLADEGERCGTMHVSAEYVLAQAGELLARRSEFQLRGAINATGVLLHTGLGRSVLPECVADSMCAELKGYVTLAVDRESGQRSERDQRVEGILCELTGAQAATVVCNNAGATLLALSALAAGKQTIVSRGQLIEIGGSFRLPDVMAASGTTMVEVGTTNRTHLRDYERAVTDATAVLLRVHPSNFRVVGFTSGVETAELAELSHKMGLVCVDDLGAGALVDLAEFGLPHEPTVQESIAAGADVVLFSADKLIGAAQGGIIVGRKDLIEKINKHPLARALRSDKMCLMALERTLHLFRDREKLVKLHPLYRMLSTPMAELERRAAAMAAGIAATGKVNAEIIDDISYLGSGSLPMEQIPSKAVAVTVEGIKPAQLARHLRMDAHAIFARVENDRVILNVRTITDAEVTKIAEAFGRIGA